MPNEVTTGMVMQIGYSARQWARRLGKKDTTILKWIRRGLPATNVAPPGSKRASWLILETDILAWLRQGMPNRQPRRTVVRRERGCYSSGT